MLFNSQQFAIFFPIVVAIYFIIPKKIKYIWLLVASYYFYMSWNPQYALLIAISTVITYASGIAISRLREKEDTTNWCKVVVGVSFLSNLGILGVFKYANFVQMNLNKIFSILGVGFFNKSFDILLPVGISFYTFQALSYTMDVYRGDVRAEKNLAKYALFVSFFPQLVAGPIERSKNLIVQINNLDKKRLWSADSIVRGFILMLWGFFMKMVIADRVAILVDTVFDSYADYGRITLLVAAVGFTLQIYCDFAGYSSIAIGTSKIMGIELMENFNTPYFAMNIHDFWSRWHISLSTWFRDYLYIPLGGNRCSKPRHYFNLMVTFLVSGLWHGASWHYVAWGGLHGMYQVVGLELRPWEKRWNTFWKIDENSMGYRLFKWLITFVLVTFAWILFRVDSLGDFGQMIHQMIYRVDFVEVMSGSLYQLGLNMRQMHILMVSIMVLFAVSLIRRKKGIALDSFLMQQPLFFRWFVMFFLICVIIMWGMYGTVYDAKQFVYFQF